jgi:hypothetical protein
MYEDMAAGFRNVGSRAVAASEVHQIPPNTDVILLTLDDYRRNISHFDTVPAAFAVQVTLPFAQFGVGGKHPSMLDEDIAEIRRLGGRVRFVWHNCSSETTQDFYESRGLRYVSLPMGTSAKRFRPLYSLRHAVRDVAFVGGGSHRPAERRMLARVLDELGPERVEIVGHGWEDLGYEPRRVTYGDEVNNIYNSARVCINLHTEEQKSGPFRFVNNRVFDISAAGRAQISDYPQGIAEHFEAKQLAGMLDEEWADSVLDAVNLSDQVLNMAAHQARDAVLLSHTWDHRAQSCLQALG